MLHDLHWIQTPKFPAWTSNHFRSKVPRQNSHDLRLWFSHSNVQFNKIRGFKPSELVYLDHPWFRGWYRGASWVLCVHHLYDTFSLHEHSNVLHLLEEEIFKVQHDRFCYHTYPAWEEKYQKAHHQAFWSWIEHRGPYNRSAPHRKQWERIIRSQFSRGILPTIFTRGLSRPNPLVDKRVALHVYFTMQDGPIALLQW